MDRRDPLLEILYYIVICLCDMRDNQSVPIGGYVRRFRVPTSNSKRSSKETKVNESINFKLIGLYLKVIIYPKSK